ncbi:unnamed protein product [Meloidogyne enterolobii]|uniref:Uncharacterized protein n=1 Tax=Meloidogyne enterolobii TaxID=390850 RepID=A0ACB0YQQ8_MELEN
MKKRSQKRRETKRYACAKCYRIGKERREKRSFERTFSIQGRRTITITS